MLFSKHQDRDCYVGEETPFSLFGRVFIESTATFDIIPQSNQGRESNFCELLLINSIQSIAKVRPSFDSLSTATISDYGIYMSQHPNSDSRCRVPTNDSPEIVSQVSHLS